MLKNLRYLLYTMVVLALPSSVFAASAITISEQVGSFVNLPTFSVTLPDIQDAAQLHTSQSATASASISSNLPSTGQPLVIGINPNGQAAADYNGATLPYMTFTNGQTKDRVYFELEYKPCGQSSYQNMVSNASGSGAATQFQYDLPAAETNNCNAGNSGSFQVRTVAIPTNQPDPSSGTYGATLDLTVGTQ